MIFENKELKRGILIAIQKYLKENNGDYILEQWKEKNEAILNPYNHNEPYGELADFGNEHSLFTMWQFRKVLENLIDCDIKSNKDYNDEMQELKEEHDRMFCDW